MLQAAWLYEGDLLGTLPPHSVPVSSGSQVMITKPSSSYHFLQNSVGLGRFGANLRNRIDSI